MRKLLSILFTFIAGWTLAQDMRGFHIGGRFGLGESSIAGTALNVRPKMTLSGGIVSNYQFNNYIGLNADFLLTSTGAGASGIERAEGLLSDNYYSYQERFDLLNVEVPVSAQASYWFGDFMVKAFAGPAMNFNLLAMQSRAYDDPNYQSNDFMNRRLDNINNVSYYMMFGVGLGALSKNERLFFLDLRINNGITPIGTINNRNGYSYYYSVGAGYLF